MAIGDRILDQVVSDLAAWRELGLDFGHVAVNLSAAQFSRETFATDLLDRIYAAGLPSSTLQVEVTETVFLGSGTEYVERALAQLSAGGIRIALDDFGTGYASLSHLKKFPVDTIKIDQSFVSGMETNEDDAAIVQAVLALSRSLRLTTVAEGVERRGQAELLRSFGCQCAQGYLYSEAVSANQVRELVDPSRLGVASLAAA